MSELNPYEAPQTGEVLPDPPAAELASRTRRLIGMAIDRLLLFGARKLGWEVAIYSMTEGIVDFEVTELWRAAIFPVLLMQWTFIALWGQSVGKLVTRTRIQRTDGSRAGFLRGALLRDGVLVAISLLAPRFVPKWVVFLVNVLDALPIFGAERCCLHDYLAGTEVVKVT